MKSDFSALERLRDNLEDLSKKTEIPLIELFPNSFIKKYSSCSSAEEFFEKSGFSFESQEDLDNIPEEPFNQYVAKVTKFDSWDEMLEEAFAQYLANKLGL